MHNSVLSLRFFFSFARYCCCCYFGLCNEKHWIPHLIKVKCGLRNMIAFSPPPLSRALSFTPIFPAFGCARCSNTKNVLSCRRRPTHDRLASPSQINEPHDIKKAPKTCAHAWYVQGRIDIVVVQLLTYSFHCIAAAIARHIYKLPIFLW